MKAEQQDKPLSGMLLLLAFLLLMYGIGSAEGIGTYRDWTLTMFISHILENYLDFILIGYVFICLQVAGYFELKYSQDYLTVSLISILFTPFSLFFIKGNEDQTDS